MSELVYCPRSSAVISEIIDGEAIIMDMSSGNYFSTAGVGAAAWRFMTSNASRTDLLAAAEAAYPAVPRARRDLEAFLDEVEAAGLVARRPADGARPAAPVAFDGLYEPPTLLHHADMKDLIELDPIHDVGEMGWPIRKDPA